MDGNEPVSLDYASNLVNFRCQPPCNNEVGQFLVHEVRRYTECICH